MTVAVACLAIFLVMAVLMATNRLPALLALPLMAVAIALAGGIPGGEIVSDVIGKGATKLAGAYTTAMFGAMLAQLADRLGIARRLVRFAAEFAGDSPFALGASLTAMTALLFSTLGGLGAVIMVGTLVLPVMVSVGIPPLAAGSVFLMGINLGGLFNLGNWQLYVEVLHLPKEVIAGFVLPFAALTAVVTLGFLAVELGGRGRVARLAGVAAVVAAGALAVFAGPRLLAPFAGVVATLPWAALGMVLTGAAVLFLLGWAGYRHVRFSAAPPGAPAPLPEVPGLALLTPFVPLILVLAFRWDILPAFVAGLAFGVATTWRPGAVNQLTRAIFEGVAAVVPAVVLIMGIGMLLSAVMHPRVSGAITPLLTGVLPRGAVPYVVTFALLAPFSLYRGPLSLWGMGSGLVGAVLRTGVLSGSALMGMLLSVGQVQGVCDPTNTQNVWVANYLGIDVQRVLRRTLPWAWGGAVVGLVLAAGRFLS